MTDVELNSWAADWVLYWQSPEGSVARESLWHASEREYKLLREDPEAVWQLVLAVLRLDTSSEIQEVLSAGPLEDLLAQHAEDFIGRVEHQARSDPSFAKLLGGVWQSGMSHSVWARVQAVRDRRGWDGIPEQ